jgi:hypothetical protein
LILIMQTFGGKLSPHEQLRSLLCGQGSAGTCYLFHVSHAGEEATIEVDRAGRVVQAAGPGNRMNAASRWGRRVLGRWGKGFPEGHEATAPFPVVGEEPFETILF